MPSASMMGTDTDATAVFGERPVGAGDHHPGGPEVQRRRQRYVEDENVRAPSVITLNAVAAARAVDDWLMTLGGLVDPTVGADHWVEYHPLTDDVVEHRPVKSPDCSHCGSTRFAIGDGVPLLARGRSPKRRSPPSWGLSRMKVRKWLGKQ